MNRTGCSGAPTSTMVAIDLEQVQIGIPVDTGADCADDQIERASKLVKVSASEVA